MYTVRHDFQRNHFGTIPRSSLIYQLQKAFGGFSHENFTAIFGTPNDVIFAAVHDMVIGLVSQHHGERCTSSLSLCQQITMSLISTCLKAGALRFRLVAYRTIPKKSNFLRNAAQFSFPRDDELLGLRPHKTVRDAIIGGATRTVLCGLRPSK